MAVEIDPQVDSLLGAPQPSVDQVAQLLGGDSNMPIPLSPNMPQNMPNLPMQQMAQAMPPVLQQPVAMPQQQMMQAPQMSGPEKFFTFLQSAGEIIDDTYLSPEQYLQKQNNKAAKELEQRKLANDSYQFERTLELKVREAEIQRENLAQQRMLLQANLAGQNIQNMTSMAALGYQPTQGMAPEGYQFVGAPVKPLPPTLQKEDIKLQNEILTSGNIQQDLNKTLGQIDKGELVIGPVQNLSAQAKSALGMANDQDVNFMNFKANLEKLRNESLRLNSGVQTEGDAQRAWNELVANINDPNVVKTRLNEIIGYNERAAAQKAQIVNRTRQEYGASPVDFNLLNNDVLPQGVDPADWEVMTLEEKAVFQ